MSDEDDCIVFSIGEDSNDDDDNDDVGAVVIQDFDTDFTDDSSDEEVLVLLTDSEDDSDSPEELPAFLHEMEDFEALNSQIVSCLAILKGGNPDSEEVESVPLCKKERLSVPEDDHMNHTAEDSFNGYRHNQITRLQRYCQNLQELTEIINSQINHLRELVSEIRRSLETPQMPPCGDDNPSLPAERQENDAETNPGGTSLQSAASPEWQQLERSESPSLPRIVCACSLQANHESGSPATRRFLLSIFSEDDENANSDLSCAQDSLAQPTAHLPQAESSLHDNFETVRDSAINNNMNPDTALPSLCIPPNFETPGEAETSLSSSTEIMHYPTLLENGSGQDIVSSDLIPPNFEVAETSLENKPETMSYSTLSGNDSGPSSSVNLPPNFGVEKFILTQMPIKEETDVENSSQTVYYPALLGSITGLGTDFSSHSTPPNFGEFEMIDIVTIEKVILIEMPGQAETTMDNSYQTVGNETVVGNETIVGKETVVGNDSDPDMGSSHLSILPSVEMLVKAGTSQEKDTPVMNQPPFLEYDSDEDASYVFIPSDSDSSTEMNSEAENHGSVIEMDSDQQTDSEPCFLTPGFEFAIKTSFLFALVPVKILVTEENSMENRPETMSHPIVLEGNNSQASALSSVLMPSNFGYVGDPRRNVIMLAIHLMAVQKKAIPRHAACYLVRILFSKEILTSSSVRISSQGCQSLDPNKIAAIREHLAAVFPNYDLSEHGEEWQACISNINSLIRNLCSRRTLKTVQKNGGPTKRKRDSNDERDGDDSASSAQVSQQEAVSETREHGNSPQDSRAFPEGIQEPSTDGAAVSSETLEYLGDPRRNIQMPKSLLMTAKEKSRPDLSARYLILSLFTEEVLINSVRGSLEFGVYSLNANKINALREFLQDIYPTCDLSENGYDWKFCVMAINSCIYSLKCDLEWPTDETQSLPPTTPSSESKPKDTDLAD
ncbi:BEN domain-containing protein 2 [Bubalus bubalis]|uniref:BEN domain-containing protein 2 n=1 Tax=Bubalus bubalis TaxID=89462 RepID=UPI001D10B14B|nr:BEN domain-containing protein 2 [Bubalus bubalis]